jgi:hypothetical protein
VDLWSSEKQMMCFSSREMGADGSQTETKRSGVAGDHGVKTPGLTGGPWRGGEWGPRSGGGPGHFSSLSRIESIAVTAPPVSRRRPLSPSAMPDGGALPSI